MKKLLSSILVILSLCMASSCTQNNGYIGLLFGQWRLHEITSATTTEVVDTIFLSFQAEVFQIRSIDYIKYEYNLLTGLFNHNEENLTLSFINVNGTDTTDSAARIEMYRALNKLHIDHLNPTFHINTLTCKDMELQYNGYHYTFEKLQ